VERLELKKRPSVVNQTTNFRPWQGGTGTPMLKVVEKRPVDESEREVSALERLARSATDVGAGP
jgi:hypothetical protein